MTDTRIITNHVPRVVIDAYELTLAERAEFDYLDWEDIDSGAEWHDFFRYRGTLYDLGEFQITRGLPEFSPLAQWDGFLADSFFSAVVVRFCEDTDWIVVGLALS